VEATEEDRVVPPSKCLQASLDSIRCNKQKGGKMYPPKCVLHKARMVIKCAGTNFLANYCFTDYNMTRRKWKFLRSKRKSPSMKVMANLTSGSSTLA
jgi:hypothetical protein